MTDQADFLRAICGRAEDQQRGVTMSDSDMPELGTVVFLDDVRVTCDIVGVGRFGLRIQRIESGWHWVRLCDVETVGDIRRVCGALGLPIWDGYMRQA